MIHKGLKNLTGNSAWYIDKLKYDFLHLSTLKVKDEALSTFH